MKERPILFSGTMVRAILDGTKTQTRLVIKPQPEFCGGSGEEGDVKKWGWHSFDSTPNFTPVTECCPYGQPGDRLWVRETWAQVGSCDPGYLVYRATYPDCLPSGLENIPEDIRDAGYRWRPSIHMPRWASRITLEVTSIRVERLQDISEADASAEGMATARDEWMGALEDFDEALTHRQLFEALWDPGSWAANPWVWVAEFKRVESEGAR